MLAWDSVGWPVALAGLPTVFIGILGRDPFPQGAIALSLFAWTAFALVLAVARRNDALTLPALLNAPVVATVVLALLLIVRLGSSHAYAYGSVKAQLFVAENLTLLVAGLVVASRGRDLSIFFTGLVAVACGTAVVLANGLAAGQAQVSVGGRYALDQQASPIGLGRAAAQGILVAIFLVLAAGPPLRRMLALGALPLMAVSFIASGSRGPVLGLAVALVVLFALTLRDRRSRVRLVLVAAGAALGGLLVMQLVPGQDVQRSLSVLTGSGGGFSANGRGQLWHDAIQAFVQHPLTGIGTGGFANIDPLDLFPHNLFLELGAEVGILGIVAAAVVVLGAGRALWTVAKTSGAKLRPELAIVAALLVAAFVNAQVSSDVTSNSDLWLAAGLALGLAHRARKLEET